MSNNKGKQFFQSKECFSRMNFLFQASMLMAGRNNTLASYYGELCRNVGKKAVLRLDPEVKRNLCKRCSLAQQPGRTADLCVPETFGPMKRNHRKKNKATANTIDDNAQLELKCRQCGFQRSFHINTNYLFWLENPVSVAEVTTVSTEELVMSTTASREPKRKNAQTRRDRGKKDEQRESMEIAENNTNKFNRATDFNSVYSCDVKK